MKRILLSFIVLAAALLSGCGESKPSHFDKRGVSFTLPEKWEITDEYETEYDGYAVVIERQGLDESGMLTLLWASTKDNRDDTEWLIEEYHIEMFDRLMDNDFEFTDVPETKYGSYDASACKYVGNIITLPHSGTIYTIETDDTMLCVTVQEADEDHEKNAPGFKAIEESFKIGK